MAVNVLDGSRVAKRQSIWSDANDGVFAMKFVQVFGAEARYMLPDVGEAAYA